MKLPWKSIAALAVALPLLAYGAGTMAGGTEPPSNRAPIVVDSVTELDSPGTDPAKPEDDAKGSKKGNKGQGKPGRQPGKSNDDDDDDDDRGPAIIRPTPDDLDDDDDDDRYERDDDDDDDDD